MSQLNKRGAGFANMAAEISPVQRPDPLHAYSARRSEAVTDAFAEMADGLDRGEGGMTKG